MQDVHEVIRDHLKAQGYAEVVAFLRRPSAGSASLDPTAAKGPLRNLRECFFPEHPVGSPRGACYRHFPRLGVIIGLASAAGVLALSRDERVAVLSPALVPSLIRPVRRRPARRLGRQATAWGVLAVGAPTLWRSGARGKNVRIGQLDTGVDGGHPALKRRLAAWAEFDHQGELMPQSRPHDPDGHGTHTAGTLVGGRSGGTAIGIAPDAELCAALVIEGGRVLLRILAGLEWAIGQGVRVVSLSLGIRGYTPFAIELFQRLRENGVLPVAAIGNEGPGTSRSPGNYIEALSVGAVDSKGRVASFSSSMQFDREVESTAPDVVAPGVGIPSLSPGGGLAVMDGTSMAAPHVAGIAALLFSARPEATVAEVESAIVQGARALADETDPARSGRGVIDGPAALSALLGEKPGKAARARPRRRQAIHG